MRFKGPGQAVTMVVSVCLHLVAMVVLLAAYEGQAMSWHWQWAPSLGAAFTIRLDGLSMLFTLLICGIGIFVQLYAYAYMRGKPEGWLFHTYLTFFAASMLGLVLAGNILLLFIFWELTTLTSYLLIGFNHTQEGSRDNALQAIMVTGAGGLALLAGLILLGQMAGTYELGPLLAGARQYSSDPRFAPSLLLILVGAFTKSAQFPFHFWLPGAMSAPAPVSAYLHSATMVKAGVYLLARLSPVFSHSDLWFWSLAVTGGITAVWAALVALSQTDLKLMLAYSTNVALGKLVFLLAFGNRFAIAAALMFIIAHAFYKAALFMVIGTVEKATGTRDCTRLAGLGSVLPFGFAAAGLAALSKSGIPPLPGFISKEYMYKAVLDLSYAPLGMLLLTNALMAALALVVIRPFLARPDEGTAAAKPLETHIFLWLPPLCLGIIGLGTATLGLPWINSALIVPAADAVSPGLAHQGLKLWEGLNLPLLLSGISLLLGITVFRYRNRIRPVLDGAGKGLPSGSRVFKNALKWLISTASAVTARIQHGRLSDYLFLLFTLLAVLVLYGIPDLPGPAALVLSAVPFHEGFLAAGLMAAVLMIILSRSSLVSIVSLGVAGFITTLFLMFYNAPDVAKTQLLVETLTVIFLVIIVRRMPGLARCQPHGPIRRLLNAGVSLTLGAGVFWALLGITETAQDTTLIDYFARNSLVEAFGRNIVNVILVDFRALDTLGEIIVVVMAALGASGILLAAKRRTP